MTDERNYNMLAMVKCFLADEDGLEMVEWGIVAAIVTIGAAAILASIGSAVNQAFQDIRAELP